MSDTQTTSLPLLSPCPDEVRAATPTSVGQGEGESGRQPPPPQKPAQGWADEGGPTDNHRAILTRMAADQLTHSDAVITEHRDERGRLVGIVRVTHPPVAAYGPGVAEMQAGVAELVRQKRQRLRQTVTE